MAKRTISARRARRERAALPAPRRTATARVTRVVPPALRLVPAAPGQAAAPGQLAALAALAAGRQSAELIIGHRTAALAGARRTAELLVGHRTAALALGAVALLVIVGTLVASRSAASRGTASSLATGPMPAAEVLRDGFDEAPVGSPPAWEISASVLGAGTVAIAPVPTSADRSVRLALGQADQYLIGCQAFPAVGGGRLLVQALIELDGFGTGEATVASVHSGGSEIAALRIGSAGEIEAGDASVGAGSASAIAANVWYDVAFDLDTASRTYGLAVSMHDRGSAVSDQAHLPWTGPPGVAIDRVCFAPPDGVAGRSLYVSELRVSTR